jgi:hypothetical protein
MIPTIKQRCAIVSLSSIVSIFKGGEQGDLMLSRTKAYEVLEFVNEHLDRMPDLTPRTLEKLALVRLHPAYTDNWQPVALRECGIN